MSERDEFSEYINEGFEERVEAQGNRPVVEVWEDDDGFGKWVAAHRDSLRTVICSAPEFGSSPFCGRGIH